MNEPYPTEKAKAVKKLKEETGLTNLEIGKLFSKEENTISDWLELANYKPIVTSDNRCDYRPKGSAVLETRSIKDPEIREKAIQKIPELKLDLNKPNLKTMASLLAKQASKRPDLKLKEPSKIYE